MARVPTPAEVAALDQCIAAYRDVDDAAASGDPVGYAVAVVAADAAWSALVAVSPRGRVERFRLDGDA